MIFLIFVNNFDISYYFWHIGARKGEKPVERTSIRYALPLKDVRIEDAFWNKYTRLVTQQIIPYQYQVLCDALPGVPESHCIENFRIAAGESEGQFRGWVFQDSDLAKWLEAVAFSLNYQPDPVLEQTADELIGLIGRAQQENGYLNTYFSTLHPGHQYCNLKEGHELYTAGHFIEAAVAYYEATGKDAFLQIMRRCADHICQVFTTQDYADAVPGHEEIELALVKLSRVTGDQKYADMALAFVDRRGCSDYLSREHTLPRFVDVWHDRNPYLPQYGQAHKPVRQQDTAEGHAVRALYLYSAMADLAGLYEDETLQSACERLYDNITQRRMYLTGGIGSSGTLERFTADYDLPNDTAYAESCASIALAMFCRRMSAITGDAKYMDTAERALMNVVLAGVSMDGKRFFYVNPLEVVPPFCLPATDKNHVKPQRQSWFGCACCPPNIARTLASLGDYAYSSDGVDTFVNLYIGGSCRVVVGGRPVDLQITTDMPHAGNVRICLNAAQAVAGHLHLRIPGYARSPQILLDGVLIDAPLEKGYAKVAVNGSSAVVELSFSMPAKLVYANSHLAADNGKCAVMKGPLVYCLEEADNGCDLSALWLDPDIPLQEQFDPQLYGAATVITAQGYRIQTDTFGAELYSYQKPVGKPTALRFVPYCHWGNREPGEMAVWVKYKL